MNDDYLDGDHATMFNEPQIISRTLGLMKLNSNSSSSSLDNLREEVFNLTIRRPPINDEHQSIDVSTDAICISKGH